MTYGKAFDAMVKGHTVRLPSWPPGLTLHLQPTTEIVSRPYFYMVNSFGRTKVHEEVMDYMSKDWEIAD